MKTVSVILLALLACPARAQAVSGDGGTSLFEQYQCPPGEPWIENADGTFTATKGRKARLDCVIAGCTAELESWRPRADLAPSGEEQQGLQLSMSHAVVTVVTAVITTYLAIVKSRSDRNCRGVANPFGGC